MTRIHMAGVGVASSLPRLALPGVGLFLALLANSAHGQIPVVLDVPSPGTYYLQVVVDSSGKATIVVLEPHRIGEAPIPTPPDDSGLTGLGKRASALFAAVSDKPAIKQEFLTLYVAVVAGVLDGSIEAGKANQALALGSNAIVGRSGSGEAWKPFREGISFELLSLASSGKYGNKEQIAKALNEIIGGMRLHLLSSHKLGASTDNELILRLTDVFKTL